MISTVNHVSFTVSNLEESIEFYKNVLGLELISLAERDEAFSAAVTGVPKAKMNIAYMKAANCSIDLIHIQTILVVLMSALILEIMTSGWRE